MNALEVLAPYIGAGGVTTIVVAFLSYRSAVHRGRRGEPEKAAGFAGISALMSDSGSINSLAISIDRLALAADKIALLSVETKADALEKFENYIDEVRKLRRAIEDAQNR